MFCSPPQLMWDLIIHLPSGSNVLADTRSLLQSMWDPPIDPLWGPVSLLAHHLVSTPFWSSVSMLTRRSVSGSDTIFNNPSSLLANIVLF